MAMTDSTGSTWRYRWVRRQNERRQRAFAEADRAWRQRDEDLRRLRTLAGEFGGSADAGAGLPIELEPGETVCWVLPAAHLVEVRHTAVLPAPDLTVTSRPGPLRKRRPDGVRVADTGIAMITNRRLVLLGGRGRRDWAYGKITGLAHDASAPVTLIQVLDRRCASGLLLPAAAAADFRFKLSVAFADAVEQRDAVLAQLDEALAEHAQRQPLRPAVVTPAQARPAAVVPGGRRTVAVAAGVALLVPATLIASAPSESSEAEVAAGVATDVPASAAAAVAATATSAATEAPTTVPPESTPSAPPDLCGAPANPMAYGFCAGTPIREPVTDVCEWLDCVPGFWAGRGHLVQCGNGSVSLAGGSPRACGQHGGVRHTFRS
ncbi:hypothetical protein HCB17_17865 [Salinispora arenicola]|uniref:hypothetical protein n=1 Tax=Salinispora arenicola TaxID=168697 RepID=UPI0014320DE8|nr:hypothetical protein [Salinispora arenicola]NIL42807.1 hypothetical protein [Salinispora arenicola]